MYHLQTTFYKVSGWEYSSINETDDILVILIR